MSRPYRLPSLFLFTTLFLLFYPGNGTYVQLFSYYKGYFDKPNPPRVLRANDIPVVVSAWEPPFSAESAYIVDLASFTPLYAKNPHVKMYPASTTKMVTALVARDTYSPEEIITVGSPLSEGQIMELYAGERITVENLMYGILVHSANDGAHALADEIGHTHFIRLMNEKAQAIGMRNTRFMNPSGLDDGAQVSTAFDLALAGRAIMDDSYLRKFVGTKQITVSDADFKVFHTLYNVNQLLGELRGVGGVKTGYTEAAGQNLVSFYKNDGYEYIIVIMKSEDRFEDTRFALQWIESSVRYMSMPTL